MPQLVYPPKDLQKPCLKPLIPQSCHPISKCQSLQKCVKNIVTHWIKHKLHKPKPSVSSPFFGQKPIAFVSKNWKKTWLDQRRNSDSKTRTELLPGSSQTMAVLPSCPSPWRPSSPTKLHRSHDSHSPISVENREEKSDQQMLEIGSGSRISKSSHQLRSTSIRRWLILLPVRAVNKQHPKPRNAWKRFYITASVDWYLSESLFFFSGFDFQHSHLMQTTNLFQPMWLEVDGWILGESIPVCQDLSKSIGKGFDLSFFHCCVLSLLSWSTHLT